MMIEINGNHLYVEEMGPKDAPAMIVHHGAPGLSSHQEPKTSFGPFADKYRVIVFDARGSGQSEGKPPFTHEQWAADIEGLRQHFGLGQIIMAGGSYGGFMALEYTTRYPQNVRALVLRDTAADDSHDATAKQNALNSDRVKVDPAKLDRIFDGTCLDDDDFRDCYAEIQPLYNAKWDPQKDAARLATIRFRHEAHNFAFSYNLPNYDLKPLLPKVQVPTLIVVGRHDWIVPLACSETIHQLIPGSRLEIFENSGHSPQLEEPEKFQAVVRDFLHQAGL